MTRLTVICISLITISLILAGISDAKVDPKNIIGMWLFDEGSGDTAKDSSINGKDGKLINGTKWVKGRFGNALEFDGVDDYVDCGDLDVLGSNTSFAVMCS